MKKSQFHSRFLVALLSALLIANSIMPQTISLIASAEAESIFTSELDAARIFAPVEINETEKTVSQWFSGPMNRATFTVMLAMALFDAGAVTSFDFLDNPSYMGYSGEDALAIYFFDGDDVLSAVYMPSSGLAAYTHRKMENALITGPATLELNCDATEKNDCDDVRLVKDTLIGEENKALTNQETSASMINSSPTPTTKPTPKPTPVIMDVSIYSVRLDENSIGTPEIYVRFMNISQTDTIDRVDFYIECYDAYGDLIKAYNHYDMTDCFHDERLSPGKISSSDYYWTIYGCDGVKTLKVAIHRYHTTKGKTVSLSDSQLTWETYNFK